MTTLDEALVAPTAVLADVPAAAPAAAPAHTHADDHGNTPAAWTAVLLCIVGFLLGGAGLVVNAPVLAIVGGAIALVSPVVGKLLSAMGLGAAGK
ncbi:MAG: hypothetical protein HOV83_33585 [Catenulispora sp.]|nr:hypothetical protein [Catenulispora sp.]